MQRLLFNICWCQQRVVVQALRQYIKSLVGRFVFAPPRFFFRLVVCCLVQVEFYVSVDDVEALGVSAATRSTIGATATADDASAMNTVVRQWLGECAGLRNAKRLLLASLNIMFGCAASRT